MLKIGAFLFFFSFLASGAEEQKTKNFSSEEQDHLEKNWLRVRKTFPQYRVDFNRTAFQEKVYKEVMQELKKQN